MRLRARPLRFRPLTRPLRWLAGIPRPHLVLGAAVLAAALVPLALRTSAPASLSLPAGDENVLLAYLVPGEAPAQGSPQLIGSLRLSSYTVQSGDTLSGIAQRFGLAMDTLISFNGIQDARALKVGLRLSLPNANGLKYRVRRGDSLEGIARRFAVALNDLLDWNRLESSLIMPGEELFVPGARLSEHDLDRVFGRLFIFPARGRLSSRFGVRGDPFTGVSRFHNGIDLAGAVGTPVMAAMSGRVSMVGFNPNYGRYIILSHAEGFQTLYGHLDGFQVRKAARVKQGELIGTMGNSGYSTGSHLHFSIFLRGEPVDPSRYLH
jgi:murein DD-endopeptidase MepM/ murein hydrolase activator NlpD